MNDDIKRIISNLVFLYGEEELSSIIKFAVYFRCDDLKLYDEFNKVLSESIHVETGIFGADMEVDITNIGPTTIMLER